MRRFLSFIGLIVILIFILKVLVFNGAQSSLPMGSNIDDKSKINTFSENSENNSSSDSLIKPAGPEQESETVFEDSLKDIQNNIAVVPEAKETQVSPAVSPVIIKEKSEKIIYEKDSSVQKDFYLTKEEVADLQNAGRNNNGFYPGVSSRLLNNALVENSAAEDLLVPQSSVTPAEEGAKLVPVTGQARGYNMIYLMHPAARDTVESQVEAMRVSGLKEQYLGVLTDGTFGKNIPYLQNVVQRLNEKSDSLTLVLYLTNGPTMRNNSFDSRAGFNQIDPEDFRSKIRFDPFIQEQFRYMAREVKPVLEANKNESPNNKNIIIVMLEDNLDMESYVAMRDLARTEIGSLASFVRNPCASCYDGNDDDPAGDPIEEHNPFHVVGLKSGDAFSNDGVTFYFPWESQVGDSISLNDLKNFQQAAWQKGTAYFGLWRAERQGIYNGSKIDPNKRVYEKPTLEQLVQEVRLLRDGLIRIN